ncbi:hypothetical protein [Fodinicola feengrottensis]|uniref:hypothetical protein n=1 Tax=Fodinicola feengrottensis TaxID=435914 RepID=UPI0024432DC9|nr:hypothetical protein [Fodinicola feengrottensis]
MTAGKATQVPVIVHNTGVEPIAVGVNARTNTVQTIQPVAIQGNTTVDLPEVGSNAPVYSVPPDTSKLSVATSSSVPAQIELQGSAAGIDVLGDLQAAQNGSTVSIATISEHTGFISKGIWFGSVQEIGPFGPSGAPSGTASYTASMRTAGFDKAVTSSTNDPYANSVDPNGGFGAPAVIQPGASAVVMVTITPNGAKGSTVTGHLNLVTVPTLPTGATGIPFEGTGEVISVLPYTYKIG